jgi:hypothetical protein
MRFQKQIAVAVAALATLLCSTGNGVHAEPQNASALNTVNSNIPSSIALHADMGEQTVEEKPISCANGRIDARMRVVRRVGRFEGEWFPIASIGVGTGASRVLISAILGGEYKDETGSEYLLTHGIATKTYSGVPFSMIRPNSLPESISISWRSNGIIAATVGGMETHEDRLPASPANIVFAVSTSEAQFSDVHVTCVSDQGAATGR